MTNEQFIYWLKGFLEASKELSEEQVKILKSKIDEVGTTLTITNLPYISQIDLCQHEYPGVWGGTVPPHCSKCGRQAEDLIKVTCNATS